MTDSRIVATATAIPDKLKDEIKKVLAYYNRISPDDLLELDVFRIEGGKIDRGERRLCEE